MWMLACCKNTAVLDFCSLSSRTCALPSVFIPTETIILFSRFHIFFHNMFESIHVPFSWTKQIAWNDLHCFHLPLLGKSVQPTLMVVALSKSGWTAMLTLQTKLSTNDVWK
jgi:hypothetical protein